MVPMLPDRTPSAWLGLGLAAVAASSCTGGEQSDPANRQDVVQPAPTLPTVARPEAPIDRAGLLAVVASAASAAAAGNPPPRAHRALDGRPFEVRIRFGCRGPAPDLAQRWLGWSFEPQDRRLRIVARPTITGAEPLARQVAAGQFEAVEGFWIPRPWLLEPLCPAPAAAGATAKQGPPEEGGLGAAAQPLREDPVPQGLRVGIVQFFTEGDSRTSRRQERPYEAIKTLAPDQPVPAQGFTLVLAGRLRAIGSMGVVGCVARGPDNPPQCIVSADLDRVWIENPSDGETVAEWTSS